MAASAALPQDSTTAKELEAVVQPAAAAPAPAPSRHDKFYYLDEMSVISVFQVEGWLFRVHRYFLAKNSPIFDAMYSLPPAAAEVGSTVEGASDANPIFLSNVTAFEFETLLEFFYESFLMPQASWIALLSIAHHFEFEDVHERAIHEIYGPFEGRHPDPVSSEDEEEFRLLISVAEKYDVPTHYIVPLLIAFVIREQPLTEDEILSFSAPTVSRLAHAREACKRKGMAIYEAEKIVATIWQVPYTPILRRVWDIPKPANKSDPQPPGKPAGW